MTDETKSIEPCAGCRDDYYNDKNPFGQKRCWSLAKAELVTRWKLGWWTTPVTPGAFEEVRTYNCHNEPGQFAFYKELPLHAIDPRRMP